MLERSATPMTPAVKAAEPRGRKRLSKRQRRLMTVWVLTATMFALIGASLLAPVLPIRDPTAISLRDRLAPPAWYAEGTLAEPLGTDHLGRSVLSRLLYAGRISIVVALLAVTGSMMLGVGIGLIAGYYQGPLGLVLMRVADIMQSLPFLALAITIVAVLGPSIPVLIIILVVGRWVPFARVVYGQVLSLKSQDFVDSARALGAGDARIAARHILPNLGASVIVLWTVSVGQIIVAESSLSFLGLGVPPPIPSWGGMLADGRSSLASAWWLATFPGLAIMLVVLLANGLGDALRDVLDRRSV